MYVQMGSKEDNFLKHRHRSLHVVTAETLNTLDNFHGDAESKRQSYVALASSGAFRTDIHVNAPI